MRIVFLTTEFVTEPSFSGGLSNYLFRTCLALKKMGHNPTIIVTSNREQSFIYRGVEVHRIKANIPLFVRILNRFTLYKFSQPLSIIFYAMGFYRKLRQEHENDPYDTVQCASYQATNLFVGKDLPTIVRLSSFEPLWRKAYEKPLDVAQRMVEWLEGRAIKKADAVFAPSRKIAVEVERALNLNVKVIEPPFLLDTRNLDLSVYQQNLKGKSYLLFYGTIGLLKGCKTIADILEPLLVRNPGLYFVFIGKTLGYRSRSMIEYILERAGSVRHRVIHFEPLHHETLYPIIKNARAVVLPSRIDNFPNTCIEAMYFGQIVVGTKGTSFEQLIQHGKSGFLCFPDNPNSLLETIVKVLTLSQNERNAVSQNAKRQVERLDSEKVTQNLIKFYEHTIQERAQRVKR